MVIRLSKYQRNENETYYKETREVQKTIMQCVNTTFEIGLACGGCKIKKTFNAFEIGINQKHVLFNDLNLFQF